MSAIAELKPFPEIRRPKFVGKPKHKEKRWSHQGELDALRGKVVRLYFSMEQRTSVVGVLLEADQFTVKMKNAGSDKIVVYFKSAISAFLVEEN